MSTLTVLDQVIDLSLVSSTVTGLSQTVSTPITSITPGSTECPTPKSSSELFTGQSDQSSPIVSSQTNNSTNEDVPNEDDTSTTAESIVVVNPIVALPTPPAPEIPSAPKVNTEPQTVNSLAETTDEIIKEVVPEEKNSIDEKTSVSSGEYTTNEVHYAKKADQAWKKLESKIPEQDKYSWPVKIQHLDLESPDVYVTGIIDITNLKDMSREFSEILIAVPHSKAKPIESDILGNDWLVKRPKSISAKDPFVRFRPTHVKDNLVKGLSNSDPR